jgi:carbon storage regulator
MLVLTRRIGEELLIAGNIRIRVIAVKGNQVRLGITAPSSVSVVRTELLGSHGRLVRVGEAERIPRS